MANYLYPSSSVIETASGPMECAIMGAGPVVMVIHGCPGGYDQGLLAAEIARDQGFQFIALSRPGYLNTPLSVGETPEAQADSYAALLDALKISQAAIIGVSGGGPSALQFALRHPDRCWGLITISAISKRLSEAEIMRCKSSFRRTFLTTSLMISLAWNLFIATLKKWRNGIGIRLALNFRSKSQKRLQENADLILALLRTFSGLSLRKPGLQNDMCQLTSMPRYPLQEISAPTLVLHGKGDNVVNFSHAQEIVRATPGANLVEIEGGHLFFATNRRKVIPQVIAFLKRHAPLSP